MKINFSINKKAVEVDVDPSMPLLWVIRDELKLKGTKYGCGRAMCGACSVHVDGKLVRSCSLPIEYVQDKAVLTIEGLSEASKPMKLPPFDTQVPPPSILYS